MYGPLQRSILSRKKERRKFKNLDDIFHVGLFHKVGIPPVRVRIMLESAASCPQFQELCNQFSEIVV